MQRKVLIANRGEIALRVIRACKELGIVSVAVYSEADHDSLHVKLADEAICIGKAAAKDSYLNMQNVLSAAIATRCNALHPGYGFLSENPEFIALLETVGIKLIGPSSEVVSALGNKARARQIAASAKIPIVPGSDGPVLHEHEAKKVANAIGYPVLLKAVSGGGGRGIQIATDDQSLKAAYQTVKFEAKANFGDDAIYVEKLIENPHHIEIQIIADQHGHVVHLGERDCSMQRRNQKMIEEAPSPFVDESMRRSMGQAAVRLAKAVGYENAGTVEFIVDKQGRYYFIEMNTRIQVEHPVTEAITGIDLVKEQLRVAYGSPLSFKQRDIKYQGHAIECRINAEDPLNKFAPSPGRINTVIFPGGQGVRIDTHVYPGYHVPPNYDSLIVKLIVHGQNRKEAIRKMRCALEHFIIDGIKTNIEFHYVIMHHPNFVRGVYDTGFIKELMIRNEGEF